MKEKNQNKEQILIDTIRTLSMDAVEEAKSGHPGAPMALAPLAFTLWDKFINNNPQNPGWFNRDRFILSNGHASMLLYSIFYLMGYDVGIEDIKNFRKVGSKCAGHPEYGLIPGIEMTTGPLGQGVATSVGFAIAGKWLAERYNRENFELFNYKVYVVCSDGDLMEGISSEAASIAGHLGLDNLIWIYDANNISIDGNTSLAFSEDVGIRFRSYHWNVLHSDDANDTKDIEKKIKLAKEENKRPSIIILKSHIAYGAPNLQDSAKSHGSPLGEDEVRKAKEFYGWNPDKKFFVPQEAKDYRQEKIDNAGIKEKEWNELFKEYSKQYSEQAKEIKMIMNKEIPEINKILQSIPIFENNDKPISGRKASSKVLNSIAKEIPWLIGGSADLTPSTLTTLDDYPAIQKNKFSGRNIHFGVREHCMAAIVNGLNLSQIRAFGSTFMIFSDYARPSMRLSAIMEIPSIFIMTHDSIGLGEDGPTHQPIEHYASFRAMPEIDFIRPADANEVAVLWEYIMQLKNRPVVLALSRQDLPVIDRSKYSSAKEALKGGYILADSENNPEIIIISTGSEVSICIEAYEELKKMGQNNIRVVSMPCLSLFEKQSKQYQNQVLPKNVKKRIVVEAGCITGWERYLASDSTLFDYNDAFLGMKSFGTSGPYKEVYKHFNFTSENLVKLISKRVSGKPRKQKTTNKKIKKKTYDSKKNI